MVRSFGSLIYAQGLSEVIILPRPSYLFGTGTLFGLERNRHGFRWDSPQDVGLLCFELLYLEVIMPVF